MSEGGREGREGRERGREDVDTWFEGEKRFLVDYHAK